MKESGIGIEVKAPKNKCEDKNCPFHGKLKVRLKNLVGKITSTNMQRTVKFEIERKHFIPKYSRYEKRRTVLKVHNPDCINAKLGDTVRIAECRPLSKTKHFVIIEKLKGA